MMLGKKYKWRCGGSNPGPFTCKANALPLSYIPVYMRKQDFAGQYPKNAFSLCLLCPYEFAIGKCLRPYHVESTSSRPITEVKQHRVALVLGWVTAWEYAML